MQLQRVCRGRLGRARAASVAAAAAERAAAAAAQQQQKREERERQLSALLGRGDAAAAGSPLKPAQPSQHSPSRTLEIYSALGELNVRRRGPPRSLPPLSEGVDQPAALRYGSVRSLPPSAPPAPAALPAPKDDRLAAIFAGLGGGAAAGERVRNARALGAWSALNM